MSYIHSMEVLNNPDYKIIVEIQFLDMYACKNHWIRILLIPRYIVIINLLINIASLMAKNHCLGLDIGNNISLVLRD